MPGRRLFPLRASALPSWCVPLLALVCFALPQAVWAQNTPGKPTITDLIPKGGCFIVKWSAPDSDGGSAITGYHITPQNSTTVIINAGANAREAQWPATCFTNETLTYNMAVRASNANGDGSWSDTVNSTLALPVLTADTAANAPDVTLSITQMANAPWYYKGTQAGATCTSVAKGTASATVTGLTVGTEHTYGAYYDSNCSEKWGQDRTLTVKFTPVAAKPPKPTNVTVSGGDASVTLGWTSGGNGGSEITKWQYLKKAGDDWDSTWADICETSSDSNCPSKTSHTVSSLNNGTTYKFKVRAVNAVDDGAESDESASVTLVGSPPKPTNVTVTGGNASVTLGWTSGGNGGSAITKWQYLKEDGGTWDGTWTDICETSTNSNCPSVASHTVSNLTNGTAYKFKVRAVNTHGDGAESDESASVTPATKPPKPTSVTVTGGDASVTLGWTSGGNGGSAITKWQYLKEEGGTWDSTWTDICDTSSDSNCPSTTSHTVSSLTNGTVYKFKVRAVNAKGDGAESDASAEVTPEGKPPKPTDVTVSSGDASVTLGWTSGGDGGSEIIKWEFLKEAGGTWDSTWTDICETSSDRDCPSKTSHAVSNLNNGTAYKFKVRAVNTHGDGAESDASASVKPAGKPPKPAKPTVSAGHRNVKVSSSVSSNNGSAITKWQYKKKTGETWDSDWTDVPNSALTESMTVTVVSLTNGTTYRFKVQALNDIGASDESDESDAATPKIYKFEVKDRTETTATLSLTGYPGPWYYKGGKGGSGACTSVPAGTTTVALASLEAGTSYTYTAHNTTNANCTSDSQLGSALTFSTLDFRLESKTNTTANLDLDNWPQGEAWSYRKEYPGAGTCNDTVATSVSLGELSENTSYTYRAYRGSGCVTANLIGTVHFKTTPAHGIFISDIQATSATLRLSTAGADIAWWHQKTAGPGAATCVGLTAGNNTVDLSGLTAEASYTWAAYRRDGCAGKIDDVTFATKKPSKPAKPTVTAGNAQVTLASSITTNGGPAITKWQYIKKKESDNAWGTDWKDISSSADNRLSTTITGLTNNTSYKLKVRAVNSVGESVASDASNAVTPKAPALTAGSIQHATATLTLANHSGSWWLKRTTPASTNCKSKGTTATESLSSLTGNTSYTYKAYSNNTCTTELATETFLTRPAKPGKPTATAGAGSGKLTLAATLTGGAGALTKWEYTKDDGANWTDITTDTDNSLSHVVSGLTDGTNYTFKVRATNATGTGPASDASTAVAPVDEALTAGSVTHNTATLTLANHPGNWWLKRTTPASTNCKSKGTTATESLSSLTGNTSYTYKAYSNSDCSTELAARTFLTKPAKPGKPTATAGAGSGKLTLTATLAGGAGALTKWEYTKDGGTNWTDITTDTDNNLSHVVSDLTDGTSYTFKVRATNATGTGPASDASTAVAPVDETLTAGSITHEAATLTLANHPGNWYYKEASGACSTDAVSTTSVDLDGLAGNTSYTYSAYSDNGCTSSKLLATASAFLTRPAKPGKPTATAGAGSGKLTLTATLTGGSGALTKWEYTKDGGTNWTDITTDTDNNLSHVVTDLTDGTNYTFKVRATNATGTGPVSDASTAVAPVDEALTAGSITHNTATLTLTNHSGNWWLKRTTPASTNCKSKGTTATESLSSLTGNTSYTYKAYSNSDCSTELAARTFLTKPAKPGKPTATAGAGSGKLTLTATLTGGAGALTKWEYTKDDGANWTDITTDTDNNLSHVVTDLTDGTDYTFKVRATNATGTGPASDASTAAAPADETLIAGSVTHNTATLTLSNHSGNWWLKRTTPASTNCKSKGTTATESLSSLTGNTSYTYKAYSDSDCSTELAARTFLTRPAKPGKPTATAGAGSGKLTLTATLTGGAGALTKWEYTKDGGTNWTDITTDTDNNLSHVVTDLTDGTNYTFKVRATNATGTGPVSDASTAVAPVDETLAAGSVTHNTATLTLTNHSGNWWLKRTTPADTNCKSKGTTATESLSSLTGNTSYTYKAYSNSDCSTELAARTFLTRPAKPGKPTATAGAGSGKLTLTATLTGGAGALTKWEYTKDGGTSWTDITTDTDNNLSHVVTDLTNGTNYTFKVRATNATGTGPASDASTAVAPLDETLAAGSVTHEAATLTLANHPGNWYYKEASGTCSTDAVSTTSVDLDGLAGNTSYTYSAYSDSGCTSSKLLATASAFLTRPAKPGKPTATAGAGSGKLTLTATLTGGSGALTKWEYTKDGGTNWTDITTDTDNNLSHIVTDLTDDTNYTFKVRATNATGTGPVSDASTSVAPQAVTLSAGTATAAGMTLTIENWSAKWYYKRTAPSVSSCASGGSAGTSTKTVTSLTSNTAYTFKAYSNGNCSMELASTSSYATLPPKPDTPTATLTGQDGELTLSSSIGGGGATLVEWQYKKKEGSGNFDATWTGISNSTSTNLSHTFTGLTAGTDYQFKVRARNASGEGAESDASASAQPPTAPLAPSKPTGRGADQAVTISWTSGGNGGSAITEWEYQQKPKGGNWGSWTEICTTPNDTTCPDKTSYEVTGLTNGVTYTFKVRAVNAVGDGAGSPESAEVVAADVPPAPSKPVAEVVSGGSGISVTLTWTLQNDSGAPVTSWQYVKKEGGSDWETDWTTMAGIDETTTTFTLTGLNADTTYRFKVRGVNSSGEGAESPASDETQRFGGEPAAPSALAATAGDRSVSLTWTPGSDGGSPVTRWQYVKKVGDDDFETTWTDICVTASDADCPGKTSHTVTGLTNGTAYRFKVRAVNVAGAGAASPESNEVTPLAPRSERLARVNETIAPELSRAMVASAVEAVRMRLRQSATGDGEAPAGLESVAWAMATRNEELEEGTLTWREALAGATFAHPLAAGGGGEGGVGAGAGGPTVWGAAEYRSLSGGGDRRLPWDGDVGSLHLGLDARFGEEVLAGLALSVTEGSFDYTDRTGDEAVRGTWKTSMTSVSPYAAWRPGEGSTVWAMLGRGAGEVEFDDEEEGRQVADSELTAAAVGGSVRVGSNGGTSDARSSSFAVEVDAALARFDVEDNGDRIGAVEVDTWRLRAALTGEGTLDAGGAGATLLPSVELGMRWDGGDGETGLGLEIGGGLGYAVPGSGFRMDANGRTLLAHGGDVKEWGVGGIVRVEPAAGGRGGSFGLGLSWGDTGSGAARLWEEGLRKPGSTDSGGGSSMRLDAESGSGQRRRPAHAVRGAWARGRRRGAHLPPRRPPDARDHVAARPRRKPPREPRRRPRPRPHPGVANALVAPGRSGEVSAHSPKMGSEGKMGSE